MKLTAKNLHAVHAAHDVQGKGWRVDIEGATWRVESSQSTAISKAMALRLAVCWNVLEGIPTQALLDGCVRDFYKAANDLETLASQLEHVEEVEPIVKRLRAADKAHQYSAVHCKCGEPEKS